jgi:hypothetical protein
MTAKELKQLAEKLGGDMGMNYGVAVFTDLQLKAFCVQLCKEQREKDADIYFDLCREYQDELHNAILNNESPEL